MKKENTTNLKNILTDYRIYIGIIVVLLIIIAMLLKGGGKEEGSDGPVPEEQQENVAPEEQPDGSTEGQENTEGEAQPEAEPENRLEANSHASVDRLVEKYCESIVNGDVDTLESIVDELTEEEKESIRKRAALIESFDNVTCYTKMGPEEDSYVVFICYDMKLINVETSAPDILCLYMPMGPDGRYIHYGDVDESMQEYVSKLEQDPDVKALFDDVRTRYQAAQESDRMLAEFLQKINGQVSGEETEPSEGEGEAPEETPAEAEESQETPEEAPSEGAATAQNRETRVNSTVNVRSEASTESSRIAVAYQGDTITQIESYENGWSKVEYKGQSGYVMTEYLE